MRSSFPIENYIRFAREYIAPRCGALVFTEYWDAMCGEGLFGVTVSKEFGGRGAGWKELAKAGAAMTLEGGDPGIVLSWMVHEIVSGFIVQKFAARRETNDVLADLARGRKIISLAVSEPGAGAHPKYLKTVAEPVPDGGFRLNGEKTWLTNGPAADWFVIIAITGVRERKKKFSAFLVPAGTPGLVRTGKLNMPFLKSSPHGGVKMTDCYAPPESLMGRPDMAYEDMAVPFRRYEDAMMLRSVMAGMERQMRIIAPLVRESRYSGEKEMKMEAGRLISMIESGIALADQVAESIDRGIHRTDLLVFLRTLAADFQDRFDHFMERWPVSSSASLDMLTADLKGLGTASQRAAGSEMMQMGERWAHSGDRDGGV